MGHRILLIDDDARLAEMVRQYLEKAGFEVRVSGTALSGLGLLLARGSRAGEAFDAVVLDLMLPDQDGLELCRTLRKESDVPLLMLTARGEDEDRIVGLELGADDYLGKPFNPRELLARLRALLRRRSGAAMGRQPPLRFGRLEIDKDARVARVGGEERSLTAYQFDLLCALADAAGRVMSRERLMEKVRGDTFEAFDRSIDVHVARIRAAIEDDPKHPRRILTIRGAGYVFARLQDEDAGGA